MSKSVLCKVILPPGPNVPTPGFVKELKVSHDAAHIEALQESMKPFVDTILEQIKNRMITSDIDVKDNNVSLVQKFSLDHDSRFDFLERVHFM
jgi:hypothetical protein